MRTIDAYTYDNLHPVAGDIDELLGKLYWKDPGWVYARPFFIAKGPRGRAVSFYDPDVLTRRQLIRCSVVGVGAVVVGCEVDDRAERPALAACFEVAEHSALLWVYSGSSLEVQIQVVRVEAAELVMTDSFVLSDVAALLVEGLESSTAYAYRFVAESEPTRWRYFRTAPSREEDAGVHFAYSADISPNPRWETGVVEHLVRSGMDFYVNLGDWPYADADVPAITLAEYREKHLAARALPFMQRLTDALPMYCIYDDHDVRCNWDAYWWRREPERVAAGVAAWDEWFPLRTETRYRAIRRGQHLEIFLLDTRFYRSANDEADGPAKTLLGTEQLRWLQEGLLSSDATFKLILSSVPLSYSTESDHWSAFACERDALIDFIARNSIPGIAFLTADRHYFAALHHESGLREFHAGPLAAGPGEIPEPGPEVLALYNDINFGDVTVHPGPNPTLEVRCRDSRGHTRYRFVGSPQDLLLRRTT